MEDSVRELMTDVINDVADRVSQVVIDEVANEVDVPTDANQIISDPNEVVDEVEDWTCAICLDVPELPERCSIVGCGHRYCVTCLVHWASSRTDAARCPTCKDSFSLISLNKNLDGSPVQSPVQETVAFVARSPWFRSWLSHREAMKASARACSSQHAGPRSTYSLMQEEWAEDALYSYFEQEFDEDDVEEYYVGRNNASRHAFGNRRFGANGYMRAGRKLAAVPKRPKGKQTGDTSGSASNSCNQSSENAAAPGRRARRKAKRF